MGAFMYHQIIGLSEPALAELANKLALLAKFAPKVPGVIFVDLHHGEHFVWSMMLATGGASLRMITYQKPPIMLIDALQVNT